MYRTHYLILLASWVWMPFGKPVNEIERAVASYSGPTIEDLHNEIQEIVQKELMIPQPLDHRITRIVKISSEYKSLETSISIVKGMKTGTRYHWKTTSSTNYFGELMDELLDTFKLLQVLIRENLIFLTTTNDKYINVENLPHLENVIKRWEPVAMFKAVEKPLYRIKEQVIYQMTRRLIGILHSGTSHLRNELRILTFQKKSQPPKKLLALKLEFEKCLFRSIDLIYKPGVCFENRLKMISLKDKDIRLMTRHLEDFYSFNLRSNVPYESWGYEPNLRFIKQDWKTKHIHTLLKTLSPQQEAKITYGLLIKYIEEHLDVEDNLTDNAKLIQEFREQRLFPPKENTTKLQATKDIIIQNDSKTAQLSELIKKLLLSFNDPKLSDDMEEVFIIYAILDFAKTYPQIKAFQPLAKEIDENESLRLKFEMLQLGQKLLRAQDKWVEFDYFLHNLEKQESFIQKQVSEETRANAHTELQKTAIAFKKKNKSLAFGIRSDYTLKAWLSNNVVLKDCEKEAERYLN
ncbi:hypothetical protein O181_041786 [Austropuccinia psidii MF-1]|uniref:Uncharacterized protein n=1 Tax=Austropuccinia psidii MF-1 TaxID=1389203 RepID=A0A9Q3DKC9_9BASI|nr:hypothetical protein [Austropuccinia psidii MF-1]